MRGRVMEWFHWVGLAFILLFIHSVYKNRRRYKELMVKYGDEDLVKKLMNGEFWQEQTHGQLLDSLGEPEDIDQIVYKTKTKETWKYNETGKNRYALKIVIENGLVVGWNQK